MCKLFLPPVLLACLALACGGAATKGRGAAGTVAPGASEAADGAASANVFDEYLRAEFAPADGFDFPFGDGDGGGSYTDPATGRTHKGWYVATRFAETYSLGLHPGEDWNGAGGGATDLGQPVSTVASGRVRFAGGCGRLWGNVVVVEHLFYENYEKRRVFSLYAHLKEIKVRVGEEVGRRQQIATVGQDPEKLFAPHLHLELRWDGELSPTFWPSSAGKDEAWVREHYAEPSAFIRARRSLAVPQREAALALVSQSEYKLRLYRQGRPAAEFDISLGQGRGPKLLRGDNRTPRGMYFVVGKHRGEFGGEFGEYYGGHWVKINYPNKFDAARGRAEGLLTRGQEAGIAAAWERRAPTLEATPLGGGIGFHGWAREWANDGPRHLSWGCVVLHLSDVGKFYEQIPEGAMVVIL